MAQNSKIEWTTHTANLWHGCTKVHEGCDNCYAETLSKRWGNDVWGNDKPRKMIGSFFNDLEKYQRLAHEVNEVHRVFVGSMMDIFEKPMPLIDSKGNDLEITDTGNLRNRLFTKISMGIYPNLMFLLLTKRPSNINKYIPEIWKETPPENVMFGTSPVNQETFNKLVRQLLEVKGKRFLSIEPQLDYVNIEEWCRGKIDWIIQGGESGHHKRPFDLKWAYFMKEDCRDLNIPYFFKQIDKIQPVPQDLLDRQFPKF
jgi:protein gp37